MISGADRYPVQRLTEWCILHALNGLGNHILILTKAMAHPLVPMLASRCYDWLNACLHSVFLWRDLRHFMSTRSR